SGMATSFCGPHEGELLTAIERILRKRIAVGHDQPAATVLSDADRQEDLESRQNDSPRSRRGSSNRPARGGCATTGTTSGNSRKRPEHMRAKKAKTPTKAALVE